MRFVKLYVHAHQPSTGYRRLVALAGDKVLAVFGLYGKCLEMAADLPRGPRDGTLYDHQGEPATLADIAFAIMVPVDAIAEPVEMLVESGWLERTTLQAWKRQHPKYHEEWIAARLRVNLPTSAASSSHNGAPVRARARKAGAGARPNRKPKTATKTATKTGTPTSTSTSTSNRKPETGNGEPPAQTTKPKERRGARAPSASVSGTALSRGRRSGDDDEAAAAYDSSPPAQAKRHKLTKLVEHLRRETGGTVFQILGCHLRQEPQRVRDQTTMINIARHVIKGLDFETCKNLAVELKNLAESVAASPGARKRAAVFCTRVKNTYGPWPELVLKTKK